MYNGHSNINIEYNDVNCTRFVRHCYVCIGWGFTINIQYQITHKIFFSSYGSSSLPIWLDNVRCTSSSTSCLANCESCPSSQYHNCGHSEDVSLECGK